MKTFLATMVASVFAVGCRSLPIQVPDLPPEQLLVNQPPFKNALQERITGDCVTEKWVSATQAYPLGRSVLCELRRKESGIK